jgi:ubiquinone/menaquinone biosynthesis C-methylase UbiE
VSPVLEKEYHFDVIPSIRHIADDAARVEWHAHRRRIIEEQLRFPVENLKGKRILDAGCGQGDLTDLLAQWAGPDGEVVGIDVGKVNLARAQARIAALPPDPNRAPITIMRASYLEECFPAESFDVIMMMNTLCYSNSSMFSHNCTTGLVNAARMLKPGGYIWFTYMNALGEVRPSVKKLVLWLLAQNDQARTLKWGRRLFRRSMEREAAKKGLTLEERLNSPYVARKRICFHLLGTVYGLMQRLGLEYYSSYPPLELDRNVRLERHPLLRWVTGWLPASDQIFARPNRMLLQLIWFARCMQPGQTKVNPCGVTGYVSVLARKRG